MRRVPLVVAGIAALVLVAAARADVPAPYDSCRGNQSGAACTMIFEGHASLGICTVSGCYTRVPIAQVLETKAAESRERLLWLGGLAVGPPLLLIVIALTAVGIEQRRRRRLAAQVIDVDASLAPRPLAARHRRWAVSGAGIVGAAISFGLVRERAAAVLTERLPVPKLSDVTKLRLVTHPDPPLLVHRAGKDELITMLGFDAQARSGYFLAGYDLESREPRWLIGMLDSDLRAPIRYAATPEHLVLVDGHGKLEIQSLADGAVTARATMDRRVRHISAHPDGQDLVWLRDDLHAQHVLEVSSGQLNATFVRPEWARELPDHACYSARSDGVRQALGTATVDWITGCETPDLALAAGRSDAGWELVAVDRGTKTARWRQSVDLVATAGKYPVVGYLELAGDLLLSEERCDGASCLVARDVATGARRWSAPATQRLVPTQPMVTKRWIVMAVSSGSQSVLEIRARDTGRLSGRLP